MGSLEVLQVSERASEEFAIPDGLVDGLVGAVAVLRHPTPRRRLDLNERYHKSPISVGNSAFLSEMLVCVRVGDEEFDDLDIDQLPDSLHTYLATCAGGMMAEGVSLAGEALRLSRLKRQLEARSVRES